MWFDVPVADLYRAAAFYAAVLAVKVHKEQFGDTAFCVLEHHDGNGGCLLVNPSEVASDKGVLVYLNVNGRITEAVGAVTQNGGQVVQAIHSIGPHGFRAIVRDSEGNRMALHSMTDG